jgi:ferritin-like metal-binding protein YciE
MEALLQESEELLRQDTDTAVVDAGLIGAAQRVEHYEIAGYGTARAYALQLGDNEAADLLLQTLDEEERADQNLSLLAENRINIEATEGYKIFQPI